MDCYSQILESCIHALTVSSRYTIYAQLLVSLMDYQPNKGHKGEVYYNSDKALRNSTAMKLSIDMKLSNKKEGRRKLCVALQDEYRLYLKLLVLSMNLSEEDVNQSLLLAQQNCPLLVGLELPRIL